MRRFTRACRSATPKMTIPCGGIDFALTDSEMEAFPFLLGVRSNTQLLSLFPPTNERAPSPASAADGAHRAIERGVVTEHGVVNLFGTNLRERAEALIAIADPRFRDEVESGAKARKLLA
jgi:hypothetical protein